MLKRSGISLENVTLKEEKEKNIESAQMGATTSKDKHASSACVGSQLMPQVNVA